MKQVLDKVIDFLKSFGMYHGDIDIDEACRLFLDEMDKGLAGQKSSFEMIPTYIETDKDIPVNEPVIVMDAGGTNFRSATCRFDEKGEPVIENFKMNSMPGIKSPVTKEKFFELLAGYVQEIADVSSNIGFCFSYPCEIYPNKDGRLILFSKEIKADEVVGQMIGENLVAALKAAGFEDDKHVVILNDTVTTLLAGRAVFAERGFDSYIGLILGTGTNCCYIEQNKNITKAKDLDPVKRQIINIESGGFDKMPRGKIDIDFDNTTKHPGVYSFEKMISGAYLGPLCKYAVGIAIDKSLFSQQAAKKLSAIEKIDTKDVNDFLTYPRQANNPFGSALAKANEEDMTTLYYLTDQIVERAAKLTAINLASVAIKSQSGTDPSSPVCIVAEGSVFYGLKSLNKRVEYYLTEYLEKQKSRYYEIVNVDNATLIGAAIAGLTN